MLTTAEPTPKTADKEKRAESHSKIFQPENITISRTWVFTSPPPIFDGDSPNIEIEINRWQANGVCKKET